MAEFDPHGKLTSRGNVFGEPPRLIADLRDDANVREDSRLVFLGKLHGYEKSTVLARHSNGRCSDIGTSPYDIINPPKMHERWLLWCKRPEGGMFCTVVERQPANGERYGDFEIVKAQRVTYTEGDEGDG